MAIADQLIFRVLPQAGQTQITNHLNGQTATGTGTPTLIDIGAEKAWSVAAGTLLNIPIQSTAITGDNGITIAIRARVTNFGTLSAQNFMGVNSAAGASLFESAHIRRNSTANNLAARYATGLIVNPSTVTFLNTVVTMISETEMSSVSSQDFGRVWVTGGGATEPNPDFSSTAGNGNATTVANFYISCSDGAAYEILDIAVFSGELTDAENWSLRQNIRAALPSTTTPITFTGTIPNQTFSHSQAVSVDLSTYFTGTQTPFTFANTGTALTGTGLTISSAGLLSGTATTGSAAGVIVTGTDADLDTASSNAFNVTVSAAAPVTFTGGPVPDQVATVGVPYSFSFASYFTGTLTPFAYSLAFGNLTGTGLSLNTSTGEISGTPTSTANLDLQIRATDTGTNTAVTNLIALDINPAGSPPAGTFTIGTITTTQTTASVPYTYSAADFDSIEYRIDGGTPVTASASPQSLTGLTSATTYGIEFRAVNAFGNGAWSTSAPFTTAAVPVGTITLTGLANNTATLWSDLSGISCTVMNEAATSIVVTKTGLTANTGGTVTFNDAAITAGTWYTVVIVSGNNRGIIRIQAT